MGALSLDDHASRVGRGKQITDAPSVACDSTRAGAQCPAWGKDKELRRPSPPWGGAAFPDLVLILQGDGVVVDLTGETDIEKGFTYSRFETAPDARGLRADRSFCGLTRTVASVMKVHDGKVAVRRIVPASLEMPRR